MLTLLLALPALAQEKNQVLIDALHNLDVRAFSSPTPPTPNFARIRYGKCAMT